MPPVRKTYRPSRTINNSVDAVNALFAKNITKRLKDKKHKKRFFQKELPVRVETLPYDDSLQISTEDTFDKLRKGPVYNKVNLKNSSKSFKHKSSINLTEENCIKEKSNSNSLNNYSTYSPRLTRQRSKLLNSSVNTSNKTDSLERRFKEPTVSKFDSLEIEVDNKHLLSKTKECLSFIKIPSKINNPYNTSRAFTNVLPYTSTPIVTPCKVSSLLTKSMDEIQKWDHKFPVEPHPDRSKFLPKNKSCTQEFSGFINLRKRKVLKICSSSNSTTFNKSQSDVPSKNRFIASLEAFNTFENSTNIHQIRRKSYNLDDFESFMQEVSRSYRNKLDTPVNFVTERCKPSQYRFLQNSVCRIRADIGKTRRHSLGSISNESDFYKSYLTHLSKVNHESLASFATDHNDSIEFNKKLIINITKPTNVDKQLNLIKSQSLSKLYSRYNSKLDEVEYMDKFHNSKDLVKITKDAKQFEDFFLKNFISNRNQFSNTNINGSDSVNGTQNHQDLIKITKDADHFESFFAQNYLLYENHDKNISHKTESRNISSNYKDLIVKVTRDEKHFEDFFAQNVSSDKSHADYCSDEDSRNVVEIVVESHLKNISLPQHCEPPRTLVVNITNSNLKNNMEPVEANISVSDITSNVDDCGHLDDTDVDSYAECCGREDIFNNVESLVESHSKNTLFSQNFNAPKTLVVNITDCNLEKYGKPIIQTEISVPDTSSKIGDCNLLDGSDGDNTKHDASINPILEDTKLTTNCDISKSEIEIDDNDLDIGDPFIQKLDTSISNSNLSPTATNMVESKMNCFEQYDARKSSCVEHKSEKKLPGNDLNNTIIDLTDSSDVIESSLLDSSQIEKTFKFIKPRRTLLLKPGKLWRRSLLMYRRSNLAITEGSCTSKTVKCNCQKCCLAEKIPSFLKRSSIIIVPVESPNRSNKTLLEEYAVKRTSYVPDQVIQENLENSFRDLSLIEEKSSILDDSAPITAQEIVLKKCGQVQPIPFTKCYPESVLQHCHKIGEGVYGEVFLFRNPSGGTSVIKIIPIEGDQIVNGERQKTFDEVLSEIIIATELSNLRHNTDNRTTTFNQVQQIKCIQGRYPERLLELWDLFDENQTSENDCPETFKDDQLYIVLQLTNGGKDLESYIFNNASQVYAMFEQVAFALAVAETQLNFEHRDLHWGNILLAKVDENKTVTYTIDGKTYEVFTRGVEATIIDFTLSRVENDGVVLYNDLSMDEELFTGDGDYQFDIYRLMQQKNGNNWQRFEPYSNLLWLHYILDKAVSALNYEQKRTKTAIHKKYTAKLKQTYKDILNYKNANDFVLNYLV